MKCQKTTVAASLTAFILISVGASLLVWRYFVCVAEERNRQKKPNVVIILADDVGYADLQSYGHPTQEWTGVDRMAKEGMKFLEWNTGGVTCTPSRAALLTGRHPFRSGIFGNKVVFHPSSTGGLPHSEVTIAEALKEGGYTTGMVGKWHLGLNEIDYSDGAHLPQHHGFDYVGTNIPVTVNWRCGPEKNTLEDMSRNCFLYNNSTIIEQPINLKSLTTKLVKDTKTFLHENRQNPFFFLLSLPQAHASHFCDPRFCGSSIRGAYGDSINEMGWAVNELLNDLIELGIEKQTLVLFLSDHGPVRDGCGEGGTAGMLRGGKGTTWEGGVRVPAVAWWPGTITGGSVSRTIVSSLDLFPTIMDLTGQVDYASKNNITMDGRVITDVIKGKSDVSPHEILFHYIGRRLMAVRYGRYKIHFFTKIELAKSEVIHALDEKCNYRDTEHLLKLYSEKDEDVVKWDPPLIFDVDADPAEQYNLDAKEPRHQEMLNEVFRLVKLHKIGTNVPESEIDKPPNNALIPCCDPPRCTCKYVGETKDADIGVRGDPPWHSRQQRHNHHGIN